MKGGEKNLLAMLTFRFIFSGNVLSSPLSSI